ncbi:hypothetical protein PYW08_008166 [Mythimna loreyi]|uniref:Uncharacterized protein n=1 Tax=Mythimna loreyi TaxID=667449 RepID=A0ACC2QB40_9NEOP|nr:hypothetical protein PYW08_008166 [Mythimna loreyi]
MERNRPPDPDPPDIQISPTPISQNPLSQFAEVVCSVSEMDTSQSSQNSRKRPNIESAPIPIPPSKQPKSQIGRVKYSATDKGSYIVHVSRLESSPNAGTTLHPVNFGKFLLFNNIANVRRDGVNKVGRNRVSVEFTAYQDANAFLSNSLLAKHGYSASIPTFNITRMGVISGVPTDITEDEAITYLTTVDNKYICGGTLVSHKHVITAAHCVTRKASQRLVDQNTLTVYLGKHNLRTSVDGVQIRFVKEIFVNPEYNASTFSRDVAVLELREPVTYTDWVRPACLWPDNEIDLKNVIGKKGSVVGWGFDETGVATEELSLVEMPVVSQETCIRSYSEFFVRFTSDYTYCAGYRDGYLNEKTGRRESTSVCNGDSGGGMVFKQNGIWYLRGLVSLSVARPNEYRCDPTHYVIFTDLAKFLPWIYSKVSDY